MDLKMNKENLPAAVNVYDGIQEQSIDLDYILPDYYPDIFRIVRCEASPVITGWNISGDKLSYELRCDISILYCGEGDSVIRSVTQTQTYQRSIDLGKTCSKPSVRLIPKAEHINFRAVNKRRFDLHGAISVKASVLCETSQEAVSYVSGMNMQLKTTPVTFAAKKISSEKQIHISEETELSPAQPAAANIVNCRCSISGCEKKMISGKLLVKGEMNIALLYSCENDSSGTLEAMNFSLPFSQVIDIESIDDSYDCSVAPEVISCEITPAAGKDSENRILRIEADIRIMCSAVKTATVMIGTDAYSTVYPCEVTYADINAEQLPTIYNESFRHTAQLAEGDSVPETVYSMWVTPKNINTHILEDGKSLAISGMLTYSMAIRDSSGMISIPDRDETFEVNISIGDDISNSAISAEITPKDVSYTISSDGILTAKSEISAKISVVPSASIKAVADISIDGTTRKVRDGDYAIKLYFGVSGEDVWDIAKRYSTCVSAIKDENELEGDRLENGSMLLIPIVT